MKDPDEIEFQQLVAQAIDEALSPREMKRLQELAGGNRDRLEQLVDHSLIASLLTEEGGAESVTDLVDLISPVSEIPQAEAPVSQSKWRSAIPSAIAAATSFVILQSPWLKTEGDQGYLGLLVDEGRGICRRPGAGRSAVWSRFVSARCRRDSLSSRKRS